MPDNIQLKVNKVALGSSGTLITSGVHAEEYLTELQGYEAAEIYNKMRRSDPAIRKILSAIYGPIKSAEWFFDGSDERAVALMEQIFFKDMVFAKKLHEILTFVPLGHSVFEVVHQNKESVDIGQYTGLQELGFRNQTTLIEWRYNPNTSKLEAVHQQQYGDVIVDAWLPADTLVIFKNESEGDDIGFPILRPLFGPYKRKLLAYELMYIGIERFAIPTPMLSIPEKVKKDSAEYIAATESLANFVSAENAYITYPEGWNLELVSKTFDPTKIQAVIQSENEEISGSIIATFLQLGVGGNTGAFNLGHRLEEFFRNVLEGFANVIKDTINEQLIPNLMRLNFGDNFSEMPKLRTSGISDMAGEDLMKVVTGYSQQGLVTYDLKLEDWIRKTHNFPDREEGNEGQQSTKVDTSTTGMPKEEKPDLDTSGIKDDKSLKATAGDMRFASRRASNPKSLINVRSERILKIMKENLYSISEKYIADVVKNYSKLSDKQKLKATRNIKIGGKAQFKKALKSEMISTANAALDMVQSETGINKKLSQKHEKIKAIVKEEICGIKKSIIFQDEPIDPTDLKRLPLRVQILLDNEAEMLSEKMAGDVTDAVAFQFNASESSTNDVEVLKMDMENQADTYIDSGTVSRGAANSSSLLVNETRNSYFFDDEVIDEIESFTFVNDDPKSAICVSLAGRTFAVNNTDMIRFSPPLHHNCKSYLSANLKGGRRNPEIEPGVPPASSSEKAQKSITLGDN